MEPMTSPIDSGSTRSERLDRLPFTLEHTRLVVRSGLGWGLDAMDVGPISFVMAALAVQWELGATTLSAIAPIGPTSCRGEARTMTSRVLTAMKPRQPPVAGPVRPPGYRPSGRCPSTPATSHAAHRSRGVSRRTSSP